MNYERKLPSQPAGPGAAIRLARTGVFPGGHPVPAGRPVRDRPPAPVTRVNRPPEARLRETTKKVVASLHAQKLARESGILVETIKGSGPGGMITIEDVRRAIDVKRARR